MNVVGNKINIRIGMELWNISGLNLNGYKVDQNAMETISNMTTEIIFLKVTSMFGQWEKRTDTGAINNGSL